MAVIPPFLSLLPRLYRSADAKADGALAALCAMLDSAAGELADDIAALYRDMFVESCDPALLGELAALAGWDGPPEGAARPRALVASRKAFLGARGTGASGESWLEALTGWPCRLETAAGAGTVFARLDQARWRALGWGQPVAAPDARPGCWRLHPLGIDAEIARAGIAIRCRDVSGAWRALAWTEADLADWQRAAAQGDAALVDPRSGRLVLGESFGPEVVLVRCAVSDPLPQAPAPVPQGQPDPDQWQVLVHAGAAPGERDGVQWFTSLDDALQAAARDPRDATIRLLDSTTHPLARRVLRDVGPACPPQPNRPRRITIAARAGETPLLRGTLMVHAAGRGLELVLSGLTIDGTVELHGAVETRIDGCLIHPTSAMFSRDTVVPAIVLKRRGGRQPGLALRGCATGPLLAEGAARLSLADSVVDGYGECEAVVAAAAIQAERCTMLGAIAAERIVASDCFLTGELLVADPDNSFAAHCLMGEGSPIGNIEACLAVADDPRALLAATGFGHQGYATVATIAGLAVRAGAGNQGEIGAGNALWRARREALAEAALSDLAPPGVPILLDFSHTRLGPLHRQ